MKVPLTLSVSYYCGGVKKHQVWNTYDDETLITAAERSDELSTLLFWNTGEVCAYGFHVHGGLSVSSVLHVELKWEDKPLSTFDIKLSDYPRKSKRFSGCSGKPVAVSWSLQTTKRKNGRLGLSDFKLALGGIPVVEELREHRERANKRRRLQYELKDEHNMKARMQKHVSELQEKIKELCDKRDRAEENVKDSVMKIMFIGQEMEAIDQEIIAHTTNQQSV